MKVKVSMEDGVISRVGSTESADEAGNRMGMRMGGGDDYARSRVRVVARMDP